MNYRPLGKSGIEVSEVGLGCWPIAGLTSPGANDQDSLATIRACFELGINHLDTAYCYGRDGESEKLIGRALRGRRDAMVIATKGGLHWGPDRQQAHDASPATLRRQCEESLRRLGTDHVDLLYLHAPDANVPVAESAGALKQLLEEGKTRSVGVSNVNVSQLDEFAAECPITAYQPPYNMLQRQIEADTLPWCRGHGVAVLVYWPLMKGLLAGKLGRDHVFAESDSRRKYPMFQGREWLKNHDLIDRLREIATAARPTRPKLRFGDHSCGAVPGRCPTVAELVINWTIQQPGITAALCGAKRPEQIRETAGGSGWRLTDDQLAQIDQALADRGTPEVRSPV
jgi:aryl-alcohol dehydrogenase-like predicted oxidoreductase